MESIPLDKKHPRSTSLTVSEAACTPSSLRRTKILDTSFRPPSPTCENEIALFALFRAADIPLNCPLKFSEIARPAASSDALTIREPEAKACAECSARFCCLPSTRCAPIDAILVAILKPIRNLLGFVIAGRRLSGNCYESR
ncbi:hypothetical protein D3C72_2064550 [compost metagenome]